MAKKEGQTIIIKKKKGHGGHGHHGGAWKVAYADFVTAMMAFFLVMWLMGTDEETKAAIAHYFNHPNTPFAAGGDPKSKEPFPTGNQVGSGDSVLNGDAGMVPDDLAPPQVPPVNPQPKEFIELSELIQEVFAGQLVTMDVSIDYMKFSVPEDVFFTPGTARLRKDSSKLLDQVGQIFRGFKGQISIASHTDDTPTGKGEFASPYEFTMARSVAVMNYMVENRWAPEEQLVPVGSGARRGVASNDTADGRKKNRRLEFVLSLNSSR